MEYVMEVLLDPWVLTLVHTPDMRNTYLFYTYTDRLPSFNLTPVLHLQEWTVYDPSVTPEASLSTETTRHTTPRCPLSGPRTPRERYRSPPLFRRSLDSLSHGPSPPLLPHVLPSTSTLRCGTPAATRNDL